MVFFLNVLNVNYSFIRPNVNDFKSYDAMSSALWQIFELNLLSWGVILVVYSQQKYVARRVVDFLASSLFEGTIINNLI